MTEELVHRITGVSWQFRADILSRPAGGFRVEVEQWRVEPVEEFGYWGRVSNGFTYADTLERAVELAREELAQWDEVPDEPSPEWRRSQGVPVSKPFDATLKTLIVGHLGEWTAFLAARAGLPVGPAEPLDTDLSSTLQADRLFRVRAEPPFVLHLELESTGRLGIPTELLRYNVAAYGVVDLPVHSVLVLLRPKATATDLTGVLDVPGADGRPYLTFRYTVVRVWQESVESFLSAGPGLAPLAVLTNEAAGNLDGALERFRDRMAEPDVPPHLAKALFGASFILSGLRYDGKQVEAIYERLSMTLEDSTTYQLILKRGEARGEARGMAAGKAEGKAEGEAEGRVAEARGLVARLGTKKFGTPPPPALDAIIDRGRLERIAERILDAAGWDDLLATP